MKRSAAFAAVLIAACAASPLTAQQLSPQAVVEQARASALAGDPGKAADMLNRWLAGRDIRLRPEDEAALRLETARHATEAGQRDLALANLTKADRLGAAFRARPALQGRFLRELARVHERIGPVSATQALLQRALAVWPASDPDGVAEGLNALGAAQLELRRPELAAISFSRSLVLLERANASNSRLVATLTNLVTALLQSGERDEAIKTDDRAAAIARDDAGLVRLANLGRAQVRLGEPDLPGAEELLSHIVATTPAGEPLRGHALMLLATTQFYRGLVAESLATAQAAATSLRQSMGEWHPALGRALHLLGTIYAELHDPRSAMVFFAQADTLSKRALGSVAPQVLATAIEAGWARLQSGDHTGAASEAKRVLAALGTNQQETRLIGLAHILSGLAAEADGRREEAVSQYRQGQRQLGLAGIKAEADVGFSLVRMGRLLTRMHRYVEAATAIDSAITTYGRLGSAASAKAADALLARAELHAAQGRRGDALEVARKAYVLLENGLQQPDGGGAFRRGARDVLAGYVRLLIVEAVPELQEEAFRITQQALWSRAGDALRRARLRRGAADGSAGRILYDQAAAVDTLRQIDLLELAALQTNGPTAAAELRRLETAKEAWRTRSAELERQLAVEQPDYVELSDNSVSLEALAQKLDADSAAIVTLTTAEGMVVWVVTRESRTVSLPDTTGVGVAALADRIRATVDLQKLPSDVTTLPFDVDAAKHLRRLLLGAAEDHIRDKHHLLFVLDGVLQSLPPSLLPEPDGKWLISRHSVTLLPSVATSAQSRTPPPPSATLAFLGIGDPALLDLLPAAPGSTRRLLKEPKLSGDLRQAFQSLQPLPETRLELSRIADLFPIGETRLLFGRAATPDALKTGDPASYRVIGFSTHAVMAGELPGVVEPAIVLSPSDGTPHSALLLASDVARLRLNADLVLLSACNTAAPDGGPFAEGLSGLSRAFFQAGARSLLVSHWAVNSVATVMLTTAFMGNVKASGGSGKAEALRLAMLEMAEGEVEQVRHPAMWAAFTLVGE